MSVRVKNPLLCSLLYFCERLFTFPIINQLNEVARIFLVPLITKYVRFYLEKKAVASIISVFTRHGVIEKRGYQLFASDIDYTVILKDDCAKILYNKIAISYLKLCKINLALGELQILNNSEHLKLESVYFEYRNLIKLINDTRKISSLEKLQQQASSRYHRTRAHRSLARVLSRSFPSLDYDNTNLIVIDWQILSQDFIQELLQNIALLPDQINLQLSLSTLSSQFNDCLQAIDFFSPYFGINISSTTKNGPGLRLDPISLLIFLSILPPGTRIPRSIWKPIKELRRYSSLGKIFQALLVYETINSLATFRAKSEFCHKDLKHLINLKIYLKAYKVNFNDIDSWITYFSSLHQNKQICE